MRVHRESGFLEHMHLQGSDTPTTICLICMLSISTILNLRIFLVMHIKISGNLAVVRQTTKLLN